MEKEKFYITTAIAYTSRKPHIGNTYEIVLADAIARFKRFMGFDVFFMTGTDEHGQKIQELAEQSGISPKQYVDNVAGEIKDIWDLMNTSYDKFIRTTDDYHEATVKKIFKKLYDQGDIYLSEYEGLYCTPCESFWTESQLVDGKCPDCGREVKKAKEEAYFFKLSKYQDRLIQYIEEHPEFIQPESRKNEMINNFLKPGLQDLCVSRTTFSWGVPVDFNPKHVIYVWIDALSNYITGLGYGQEDDTLYKKYWPANVHLIGKDILRFHTLYWPIMLMALGEPLPKQVFGHPWLLSGEDKMSKSKGNVIYADDLVKEFGVDAVRYFVLREMPFAQDGSISYELLINKINSDLANILGNLVNRTIAMSNKYFDGIVENKNINEAIDEELKATAMETVKNVQAKMDELRVADAIDEIWNLLRKSNKYIDETTPWALAKDESQKDRLATVLYNLIESIRIAATLLHSYLPETAEKIAAQLNLNKEELTLESVQKFGYIKNGLKVTSTPTPLFDRIDAEKKIEELLANTQPPVPETPKISIDDFYKSEMRVAKVLECENVPKSSKLLKFKLDLGTETRTVLSGIAKFYKPEDLIGKSVIVVTNLKPAKIMGIESNGMILSAVNKDESELTVLTIEGREPGDLIG